MFFMVRFNWAFAKQTSRVTNDRAVYMDMHNMALSALHADWEFYKFMGPKKAAFILFTDIMENWRDGLQ